MNDIFVSIIEIDFTYNSLKSKKLFYLLPKLFYKMFLQSQILIIKILLQIIGKETYFY